MKANRVLFAAAHAAPRVQCANSFSGLVSGETGFHIQSGGIQSGGLADHPLTDGGRESDGAISKAAASRKFDTTVELSKSFE